MKTYLNHIQLNIDFQNIHFYKSLMNFLGWVIVIEKEDIVGFQSDASGSIWFLPAKSGVVNDYDGPGVNHIGIGVDSILPIDEIADFLQTLEIKPLFGTPKYRPEFSGDDHIYYQIMFESPDKILFEVVRSGPKEEKAKSVA